MYELAFCCPYDSRLFWDGRNTFLNNHWFVIYSFSYEEYTDILTQIAITNMTNNLIEENDNNLDSYVHKWPKYPQIVKIYYKDNNCLCIIKTLWLKIFQRKYKNYYNKKMSYYKNPKNVLKRQIYGKLTFSPAPPPTRSPSI